MTTELLSSMTQGIWRIDNVVVWVRFSRGHGHGVNPCRCRDGRKR